MKKSAICAMIWIIIALGISLPTYASDTMPSITINGVPLITEVQPFITPNGTTMVQFRPLFEKLGLEVGWDQTNKVVTGTRHGLSIEPFPRIRAGYHAGRHQ